jgi:cell division protein FtsW
MCAYGFIGYRGFRIATKSTDPFAKYFATGMTLWILVQASLNMGVNLNVLPLTGVTLPFVSYGGSSLISLLLGMGILLNISRTVPESSGPALRNLLSMGSRRPRISARV